MGAVRQLAVVENRYERSKTPCRKGSHICSEVVARLAEFAVPGRYPRNAILFVEGQPSRGVFILYTGQVKLYTSSACGKNFILGFANPGEILGLAGAMSGQPHEACAEAIQPTQASFVERKHLIQLIEHHYELAIQVAMQLGESYCSAIAGARLIGHSQSASQKLATFLLDWYKSNPSMQDEGGARLSLTHEEIAQVIGTSRETVTRLLSGFKKKGLIEWKNCNLVLTNRAVLERSAAG
jgi:CRP/FNR family transcriptional regulator